MFLNIYKKLIIDYSKFTLAIVFSVICIALYFSKNFNLDASSDALLLEGDKDLQYLREVNERYNSKDFLVLTYSPIASFEEEETIINLQLLKSKIEKLSWVESVITIIDVPLLKSTDEPLMERLKNYKTLSYPEIDRERGFCPTDHITELIVDQRLINFSPMLASFGFDMHLITLPEFHVTAYNMHKLSDDFRMNGINAFVKHTQRPERIYSEADKSYTYYKHQTATGTGVEASFNQAVGSADVNILDGSTEADDFKKRD